MRLVLAVAAAFALVATPALAQSPATTTTATRCADLPADPHLPAPANANAAAMRAGDAAYQAWARAYNEALTCRTNEIADLRAQEAARRAEYNTAAQHLNTVTNAWVAQAQEFNAKQHPRR